MPVQKYGSTGNLAVQSISRGVDPVVVITFMVPTLLHQMRIQTSFVSSVKFEAITFISQEPDTNTKQLI